jgi:lipoate-protein ligase A
MRRTKSTLASFKNISVYRSTSVNPFVNLAVESWLFSSQNPDEYSLYLWRNGPSVIIGKFQSAWRECNIQKMNEEKVNLVRRSSGGGAVYQDLGNSIFSFFSPRSDTNSIARNNAILLDALKEFNVNAVATGRNDLHVDGRKVSGAAFKNTKDRSLHHGTLLYDLDMTALSRYLTPNKVKLQSKGVSSVEAHVMNLKTIAPQISHSAIGTAITNSFFKEHGITCDIIDLDEQATMREEHVRKVMEQLQDWDWRFGSREPQFTHQIETSRLSWGTFDVNFVVKAGIIENIAIYCDALDVPLVEIIQKTLIGIRYSPEHIKDALQKLSFTETSGVGAVSSSNKGHLQEFIDWLLPKL